MEKKCKKISSTNDGQEITKNNHVRLVFAIKILAKTLKALKIVDFFPITEYFLALFRVDSIHLCHH